MLVTILADHFSKKGSSGKNRPIFRQNPGNPPSSKRLPLIFIVSLAPFYGFAKVGVEKLARALVLVVVVMVVVVAVVVVAARAMAKICGA